MPEPEPERYVLYEYFLREKLANRAVFTLDLEFQACVKRSTINKYTKDLPNLHVVIAF